jgi:hypothetical protein
MTDKVTNILTVTVIIVFFTVFGILAWLLFTWKGLAGAG